MIQDNHVVIMAGGMGSRFWPLSTLEFPKQFIDVLGCGKSLIQLTVERFSNICLADNFWVVTNERYVKIVKEQLPGIPNDHILAEPASRNTAPCIAWACWSIQQLNPCANVVVTPADAMILDVAEFQNNVLKCLAYTKFNDVIVTLGIKPSRAETGYGYLEIDISCIDDIVPVKNFKEKPTYELACHYLNQGNYLWNAGIFVWNLNTIINCINRYSPDIADNINQAIATGNVKEFFLKCKKISIDYAVIEPASRDGIVYTYPADIEWSDLGNWSSLHDKLHKDEDNNGYIGNVSFYDCSDCVVHTVGVKKVILQGLKDYIVAENNGYFLVCKKDQEQRIKDFI